MSIFDTNLRNLAKEGTWGPFLVSIGLIIIYLWSMRVEADPSYTDYVILGSSVFLLIAGVLLMFRQLTSSSRLTQGDSSSEPSSDADYVVRQLSRNYEILRSQTNQGFLLSGAFMAVGLLVIVGSLFAPSLGLTTGGVNNLGMIVGTVTEFISGTALLLYRLNFKRLNETSDRLDDAWRVLAAYNLTRELPDEQKADATLRLISSLTIRRRIGSSEPDVRTYNSTASDD